MHACNYCIIVLVMRLIENIYPLKIQDNPIEQILLLNGLFSYYRTN